MKKIPLPRRDMEQPKLLQNRVECLLGEEIEQTAFTKIAKKTMCLSYAYDVQKEMANSFICLGYEENQPNQLAHDCVMLSREERMELYFDDALQKMCYENVKMMWRNFIIRSINSK